MIVGIDAEVVVVVVEAAMGTVILEGSTRRGSNPQNL